jgi:predicted ferric reductase
VNRVVLGVLWAVVYLVVASAPLVLALVPPTQEGRGFWTELSVALGFVGLSMIGLQFALTARFQRVAAPFGLDVLLQFHRQVSLVAFGFILVHPAILMVQDPGLLSVLDLRRADWQARFGVLGVLALVALVVTSVWRVRLRLSYEAWRLVHGLLAVVAVALALAHVVAVGHYVATPWKTALWVTISVSVVLLLAWTRVVAPLRILRRPYVVERVRRQPGDSWSVELSPDGHDGLHFRAGQFAWLTVGGTPFQLEEHPFSFSSSAERPERLELTIKELGDFTSRVGEIEPGSRAYLDGPYGAFSTELNEGPGFVAVAGGVGITPVMSILRTLADRTDRRPVLLFHANPDLESALFGDELEQLGEHLDLDVVDVLEHPPEGWAGESGFIDTDVLRRHLPEDAHRRSYFVCGPDPMMDATEQALVELGVPREKVAMERFALA